MAIMLLRLSQENTGGVGPTPARPLGEAAAGTSPSGQAGVNGAVGVT